VFATKELKRSDGGTRSITPTTSSTNSLIEGFECESPFGMAIVDERDSVFVWLRERRESGWGRR